MTARQQTSWQDAAVSLDLTIPILEPFTDASLESFLQCPSVAPSSKIISPRIFPASETSVVEAPA